MEKVYKSKWGYHPISLEQSKKLRFINKVFAKAQHRAAAWVRWNNKQPQNRILKRVVRNSLGFKIGTEVYKDQFGNPLVWKEPDFCDIFYTKIPCEVWSKLNGKWGWHNSDTLFKLRSNDLGYKILEASRIARTPKNTLEEVQDFTFTDQEINDLYDKVKKWMEK